MTPSSGSGALAERIAALQAKRLAPVPRASHVVAIDARDLAVVLDHLSQAGTTARGDGAGAEVAAAYQRLSRAASRHAAPGSAGPGSADG